MKILLVAINTKYIHSNLAVYTLKASAGEYKDDVFIKEYTINNTKDAILRDIYKERPDLCCFSVYIWNVEYVKAISKEFSKLCPDVPIIVGGPEVTYDAKGFLIGNPHVKGVIIGEGEATFREVCRAFCEGESLKNVSGLMYREEGEIVFTGERDKLDMDTLEFPYSEDEDFTNRIIYYETSRGCPFGCSYCLSSVERDLRFKNFDIVKRELDFFLRKQVKQVKFVDRTFNCDHGHALKIWKYIKENDNGITNFHFEVSADLIKDEELKVMEGMRPGLIQLEIGVQSVNELTIKEIHRTMRLEKVKEIVKKIEAFGNIHEHLDLIAGLPYENLESFVVSFNEIYALKPNQLQLGFLKVLKGSYMYEHREDYGLVYTDNPPYEVMSTKWISYDDILLLKLVEEMVEVYYNSGQFEVSMRVLEGLFDSAFDMYKELGLFYERKDYIALSHTRNRRGEILLEFMEEQKIQGDCPEYLREALTVDIYLRENSKTRPSFSKDLNEWKDISRKLIKKGKLSHLERIDYRLPLDKKASFEKGIEKLPEPIYILFDYEKRNPLNNQAEYEIINGKDI